MNMNLEDVEIRMSNDELNPNDEIRKLRGNGRIICHSSFDIPSALVICQPRRSPGEGGTFVIAHHCPNGVVTSVPDGGLNSKVEAGTGARVWFEYAVTIRSPLGSNISVRSTRRLSLIRRSSF